ncbi:MAG TPA: CoA pyrophosphatase [Acidimicrobiales bacterium]|nr:CoA pyrophosphatase [Acidimicrobiales bacterium]
MKRGGPQLIPRPQGWRPGGLSPWSHLDPDSRRVDLDRLEEALAARGPGATRANPWRGGESDHRSAVLVPLYDDGGEVYVVMTRRSPHLRKHRWEVSFPGGRRDEDDESLWHTARRETYEEIGLDQSVPRLIGELDRFVTVSSVSLVSPLVAVLPGRPTDLVPSPHEVEAILHVPVSELLLDDVFREEMWPIDEIYRPITFFELDGDTVWGATAAMLRQLLAIATETAG